MSYSYWELKEWFTNVNFTIVGSGIVGLNCALYLKQKYPKAKIIILEKGVLPQGASSKNAGFACFGSLSELIDDLKNHSEEEVFNLVKKRWNGLELLRKNLGDKKINFQQNGGYELFLDSKLFDECLEKKNDINSLLNPLFKRSVFKTEKNIFNFANIYNSYITNIFEGQIDTGKMVIELLKKVMSLGVQIINATEVIKFDDNLNGVSIKTSRVEFTTEKLLLATNGFSKSLLNEEVKPARAQVLITKPIENLFIKGTFHLDKGYYYFRNIDNRILFGGGRNLDFKAEETTSFNQTKLIQNKLEEILKETILPNQKIEIAHRWSGIMGVGTQKKAIIKQISNNVYCGVRLGGMGVAIGSIVGKELAELV
ncbi:NAD(P)/FAD-dependent oxidoreductase [Tenacibaculum sp. MAR_2009_124]|uniref:NAD(P)/FAD-dependent oxidoreductase n=1 Tax=Tenacibaculum sp. MAR_2009_124 TaxID=1250059 RepID=UPI000B89FACB|nr:FAD-dependent oxidoreductase [Tenacibaculum sp. MAR_2009_124]